MAYDTQAKNSTYVGKHGDHMVGEAIGAAGGAMTGAGYNKYHPAYCYGVDAYGKYKGCEFDDIEPQLSEDWKETQSDWSMSWNKAKPAVRDAYDRLKNHMNDNVKL